MYITELRLTRPGQRLARDSHALHRVLTFAADGRVMWALPTPGLLIAQAEVPLRPDALPGLVAFAASRERVVTHTAGTRIELAGVVNPTRSSRVGRPIPEGADRARGARTPLDPADWPGWVERKLGHAVRLDHVDARHDRIATGNKPGHRITTALVAIHATGTVSDPSALAELLLMGVGPAKSLGAGLILTKEIP